MLEFLRRRELNDRTAATGPDHRPREDGTDGVVGEEPCCSPCGDGSLTNPFAARARMRGPAQPWIGTRRESDARQNGSREDA